MRRIFAEAPPLRATAGVEASPPRPGRTFAWRPVQVSARRGVSIGLGGVAVAAFLGLGAGAVLTKPAAVLRREPPPAAPLAATVATAAVVLPAKEPLAASVVAIPAKADAQAVSEPLRPAVRRPAKIQGKAKPPAARKRMAALEPKARDKGPCAGLRRGAADDCWYDRVLAADGRLRRAYEAAVREGVPADALKSYRRDWVRARRSATRDPQGVVRRYDALAEGLRRLEADRPQSYALR